MLLALETANDQCSVALSNQSQVVADRHDSRAREQTRMLLPMIDQVLSEAQQSLAQLEAIAFSRGPGSFSGIRINAAVAQALAWAHDLPVVAVSTLQAVAQASGAMVGQRVLAVLDARMNEIYAAAFEIDAAGIAQPVGDEQLVAYHAVQLPPTWQDQAVWIVGSGAALLDVSGLQIVATVDPSVTAHATQIAQLAHVALQQGQQVSAAHALPVYLRDNAWKKIAEQGRR